MEMLRKYKIQERIFKTLKKTRLNESNERAFSFNDRFQLLLCPFQLVFLTNLLVWNGILGSAQMDLTRRNQVFPNIFQSTVTESAYHAVQPIVPEIV